MRRWLPAIVALTVVSSLGHARADHLGPPVITVTHEAPLPCSVACAYWDAPDAAGYNECGNPFPQGSYDESTFRLTSRNGVVHIQTYPVYDYDSFVCTDTEPSVLVTTMAPGCCYPCHGIGGNTAIALACEEGTDLTYSGLVAANAGANDRFVIISYNWSDTEPLPVKLWGPVELIDDSFEASIT